MADNLPALRELRKIPGVGPKIAEDLWRLGIHSLEDLKNWQDDKAGKGYGLCSKKA
jgi:predicted flap endonuclease-1-like 5' DNA nuclease